MSAFVGSSGDALEKSKPLTRITSVLPCRLPKGLSFVNILWTSIDVCDNWLALGSYGGTVYVCSRLTDSLEYTLTTVPVTNKVWNFTMLSLVMDMSLL
jgi:hypothetical protein